MTFIHLDYTVCLEIKKAQHNNVITAINTQLTEYMIGEETEFGIYLILWYKTPSGYKEPKGFNTLEELIENIKISRKDLNYKIVGIDCSRPISPTKNN
jgi:hypothetical protein